LIEEFLSAFCCALRAKISPVGQTSADLLRILLADNNDANAFLFQCGVNRLARPCAFQRVAAPAQLPEKFQSFRPSIVIASGIFAEPDELKGLKEFTNGHPVICAVPNVAAAEAALAAGAADCVLISQVDELHACIERHLSGENQVPYFKKDLASSEPEPREKAPSKLDQRLQDFDRWVGAKLRQVAKAAKVKWEKLGHVSGIAWAAARAETLRRYKELKVQWLLRKERKIVQSSMAAKGRQADAGFLDLGSTSSGVPGFQPNAPRNSIEALTGTGARQNEPQEPKIRITSREPIAPLEAAPGEAKDDETLRTLELSFKTLFHTALDPMFLLDGLGCFLHANAPACSLLGLTSATVLGKSFLDFVPNSEKAQVSAMWEAMLIEGQQKGEVHLRSASGEMRDVLISARSNLWFGVHLLIVREQTELKRLRETVRSFVNAVNPA
jgi:PAS domain S-box-containing protein